MADNDPFLNAEVYNVEARLHKTKGKDKADDVKVLVTIPITHPLVGFTRDVTSLEFGRLTPNITSSTQKWQYHVADYLPCP